MTKRMDINPTKLLRSKHWLVLVLKKNIGSLVRKRRHFYTFKNGSDVTEKKMH